MQHIWSVLCEQSLIDSDTHLISLVNCIEEIEVGYEGTFEGKISVPVKFQLASFWAKDNNTEADELDLKIEIVNPDKNVVISFTNKFPVAKEFIRFRTRMNIQGMDITMAGRHLIRLLKKEAGSADFAVVSEAPIDIKLVQKK